MNCPNCKDHPLRPVYTRQGVEVDTCDQCQGVWLDKGEIFHFAKNPGEISERLKEAAKNHQPTDKLSPRGGSPLVEMHYPGGPLIDACLKTGGLWFDDGELKEFLATETGVHMDRDMSVYTGGAEMGGAMGGGDVETTPTTGDTKDAQRHMAISTGLLALPNLFIRSTLTITGLYAILIAILIGAVEFADAPVEWAVMLGIGIILLQFAIGPFLMDLSMRWMYKMEWVDPANLPEHMRDFLTKTCSEQDMKIPRFGVIDDGAPQAFTYGHTPNNARIVVSRGIFELLLPEEAEAVVAHEIGHAKHWDMLLMTIVQLVPLILYYIYRLLIRMGNRGGNRDARAEAIRYGVAIGAFILYIISEYIVLWFSRTREYHADRFAGVVTGNPSYLAGALVKIAYGLAAQGKDAKEGEKENQSTNLEVVGAMGIFDGGAARSIAATSYGGGGGGEGGGAGGGVSKENLKGAMRWDLWNPWAKWFELNSTHPLVANRLRYLSDQAAHMGKEPYVVFDEVKPESYWDEFFVDLSVKLLPTITVIASLIYGGFVFVSAEQTGAAPPDLYFLGGVALAVLGFAKLIKYRFTYRGELFPEMSVAALLKKVKVSGIRPVPCSLQGKIIGRGVPGYILSDDFVMKDATGIMFLDHRQPLAIWEMLFGLFKAGKYDGKDVVVVGWYRRAPVPFVQVKHMFCDGDRIKSWVPALTRFTAIAFIVAGVALAFYSQAGI